MKIGRNDLCYCGSGKKYKKCHWLINDKSVLNNGTSDFFEENEVLKNVLQDKIFNKYYNEFRPKIKQNIKWQKDLSLPQGIDFRRTVTPKKEQIIRLRTIPAKISDSIKIAHEIHHIIIDNKGFPSVGCKDKQYEDLSSSLASMLHDLLIEEFQQNYGFDILSDFEKEVKENKRQLKKRTKAPQEHLEKCKWIFNYCGSLLSWGIIEPDHSKHHPFHSWFEVRFKDISDESYELLKIIKEYNYKTHEGMKNIFVRIIAKYKLQGKVFLVR